MNLKKMKEGLSKYQAVLNPSQKADKPVSDVSGGNSIKVLQVHHPLLTALLDQIKAVDFRKQVGLKSKDGKLKQKHYLICIIDTLFDAAWQNQCQLCCLGDLVYIYNGMWWLLLERKELKAFLSQAALKMGMDRYEACYFDFGEKLYRQFIAQAPFPNRITEKNKILINLQNGTFEFENGMGRLRAFQSSDFLTYQLPFAYDPSAKAPEFIRYLDQVLPDAGLQHILAEFMGYVFTQNLKLEKCLFLYGSGANGKSVFFQIMCALFGKENMSYFSLANLNEEHNRALLDNKLLNYSSESIGRIHGDIFKLLVSAEEVQARMKYGDSFFLRSIPKLCFNCNQLPSNIDCSDAFFRRLLIVPFQVKISEDQQDKFLAIRIITHELPAIFNWVLQGLDRLIRQKGFTASPIVDQLIEELKQESDTVRLFLEECGYQKSLDCKILLEDLFQEYRTYCINSCYSSLNKSSFNTRLKEIGYTSVRQRKGYAVEIEKK